VTALELLRDGPSNATTTIVLAHGAGAGMRHPFLAAVASGLAAHGLAVVRFDFPYMAARSRGERRPPDRFQVLLDCMREVVRTIASTRLVLAGKSMGARVATMLADELGAAAAIAFGYPFHPPKQPDRLRTEHLATIRTKTLIVQGERDEFGTPGEIAGYALSPAITLRVLADGDHSLKPRRRSGHSADEHLGTAIALAAAFARGDDLPD
jgi:uncharacterized protein